MSHTSFAWRTTAIACCWLAAEGCRRAVPSPDTRGGGSASTWSSLAVDDWALVLEHDFGRTRPGEVRRHVFQVRNDSSTLWTLERAVESCTCGVARASAKQIPPGTACDVEFVYQAPAKAAGTISHGEVTLEFSPSSAPRVVLSVSAAVRAPVSVAPAELIVHRTTARPRDDLTFIVENCSDAEWSGIEIARLPTWLELVETRSVAVPSQSRGLASQAWEVSCRTNLEGLESAFDRGELEARAVPTLGAPTPEPARVIATLSVARAVTPVPSVVNFGVISGRTSSPARVLLISGEGVELPGPDRIAIEATANAAVATKLLVESSHRLALRVTVTKNQSNAFVDGVIKISIPGVETLAIPLQGRWDDAAATD